MINSFQIDFWLGLEQFSSRNLEKKQKEINILKSITFASWSVDFLYIPTSLDGAGAEMDSVNLGNTCTLVSLHLPAKPPPPPPTFGNLRPVWGK